MGCSTPTQKTERKSFNTSIIHLSVKLYKINNNGLEYITFSILI